MAQKGVKVHVYGDWDGSAVKRAKQDLSGFQKQAQGFTGAISKSFVGMGAAIGGALALGSVVDFAKGAISAGSDLQESLSKTSAVFGDNADAVVRWSENSATAFGQSKQQALEAAGTFGNLLIAFGSTTDEAQVMSQRMVELAADLASFNNTSVDDALNALRSGLSGETEPLKRFGVALNDARLKTVALERGLYSGKGTLDTYAKSVAAYELILKDTALAQGDFARTSDGLANQQRTLEATFTNLQTALGSGIIDGFGDLGANGKTMVDAMEALQPALESVGYWIGESGQDYLFLVAQTAALVSELHNLVPALGDTSEEASLTDQALGQLGNVFSLTTGSAGFLSGALQELQGTVLRKASDSLDGAGTSARAVAGGLKSMAESAANAADDTMTAEEALKALKDQVNALKGAISDRQAMDDFRKSLRDLGETLKDNERTFKGMSDAALENRETLRTAFSDAADIVQGWVESGKISADEFDTAYAKLGSKVVDNFVKQGFTRSDIRKFLKSEGMWMAEFATVGDYASAAGVTIGKDLLRGMAGGLSDPNNLATLRYAAMQAAREAENAVREESKTQSPSKVFAEIGKDLTAGLVQGIRAGGEDVRKSMQAVYLDAFRETKQKLKDELKEAKDAFNDFRSTVSQAIMGGIDFGAIAPEFDENGQRVGMTFIEALNAQAVQAQQFAEKVKLLVASGLSQEALQRVLQAGVEAGTAIADELIAGGTTTIDTTNKLVESTQAAADLVGTAAAEKWYGTGVKNAQDTYEGFKANFGKGGPAYNAIQGVMDRLAASMNRTATITVTTINRQVNQIIDQFGGARALGGPVAANTAYLVGERGPELFVPDSAGMIVPNADLPTASGGVMGGDGASLGGNTYNITVQAGVGDPRQIGQQVVEYIKRFEKANGAVFAAA